MQYVEQVLIDDTSLDTLVTMSRKTSGIVRGQMLYDDQLGLFRARDDTTTLDGIAELRYPDGRSFRKRARDEVMRRLTTYDAREYTARRDSVQRERMRNSGGVVFVPANDVDQRLTKGDARRSRFARAGLARGRRSERLAIPVRAPAHVDTRPGVREAARADADRAGRQRVPPPIARPAAVFARLRLWPDRHDDDAHADPRHGRPRAPVRFWRTAERTV